MRRRVEVGWRCKGQIHGLGDIEVLRATAVELDVHRGQELAQVLPGNHLS